MNRSNYFIENKAIFGVYPTQEDIHELEDNNVFYFLDLTVNYEPGTVGYHTSRNYENYPIGDRDVPKDTISFTMLLLKYSNIIKNLTDDKKVYIHCRGGHGRSGMVAACLLAIINKCSSHDAMNITSKCHSERLIMTEKWRRLGSPQSKTQRNFVNTFFRPFYMFIGLYYQKTPYFGFCKNILEIYSKIYREVYDNVYGRENGREDRGENSKVNDNNELSLGITEERYNQEKYHYFCDYLYQEILNFFIDNIQARDQLLKTGLSKLIFNHTILYKITVSNILEQIRLKFYNEMLMVGGT